MKSKKIITIILCVALIIVSGWVISSFSSVKKVSDLNGDGQKTMELVETETVLDVDMELENEVPEQVIPEDVVTGEETPSEEAESTEGQTEDAVVSVEPEVTEPEPMAGNPEAPVLELTSDRVVIAVGAEFNVISPVERITDNKDDSVELYRHIRVGGEYDVNVPGEYVLEYIVTDLDGNDSDSQKLTLVVEE